LGWRVSVLTALTSGDVPALFYWWASLQTCIFLVLYSAAGRLWGIPTHELSATAALPLFPVDLCHHAQDKSQGCLEVHLLGRARSGTNSGMSPL